MEQLTPNVRLRTTIASRISRSGTHHFPLNSGIFEGFDLEIGLDGKAILTLLRRERLSGDPSPEEYAELQNHAEEDAREGLRSAVETLPALRSARLVRETSGYLFPEGPHPAGCHVLSPEETEDPQGAALND